jgi:CMP-N-acetylneuraminic acid synthetase
MIKSPTTLCIIPAKGSSKRFPKKNIALLDGKPLLSYSIEAALKSNIFGEICVSSEDEKVLKIVSKYDEITLLKRPAKLATDSAQVKDVCFAILQNLLKTGKKFENLVVLIPTSPLRKACDIRSAYQEFINSKADSLFSVISYNHPPLRALACENGIVKPFFGHKYQLQSQKLKKLYRHDGLVLIVKTKAFLEEKSFFAGKTIPFFSPAERSVDIDYPEDLQWAEFLLQKAYKKIESASIDSCTEQL